MRRGLHGESCFAPSWPTFPTLEEPTTTGFTQESPTLGSGSTSLEEGLWLCRLQRHVPDQAQVYRDTGAELILIILLLAGGIIYAIFASNPMSFDDLIELRFLRSRRRQRDREHIEHVKSMLMPRR
jgi:hypothetical protein